MKKRSFLSLSILILIGAPLALTRVASSQAQPVGEGMIAIPAGTYQPFFGDETVKVPAFQMDRAPVTNRDLNRFIEANPRFAKSRVARVFAERGYLAHWSGDTLSESEIKAIGDQPAANVSWFVARQYCASLGKRLPSIDEWEYAADASAPEEQKRILDWYAQPGPAVSVDVAKAKPNRFGLHDMNGVQWEWVEDFTAAIMNGDSRSKGERTEGLFCGAGSMNARDPGQYATFMRYAFRSGLKGAYTIANLGFRCAHD
jgi:formylglycine-generating enzyme required for sulfatase activity